MDNTPTTLTDDNKLNHPWNIKTDAQTLFDTLPIGIAISEDVACEQVRGNAEFHRIFKIKPGNQASFTHQLKHPVFRAFHNGRELTRFGLPMQRAIRLNKTIRNFNLELKFPRGNVVQILANANPLRTPNGEVRGAVATYVIVRCPDNPTVLPNSRTSQLLLDLISQAERNRR